MQLNSGRRELAQDALMRHLHLRGSEDWVLCVQEPSIKSKGISRLPRGYEAFWYAAVEERPRALVIAPKKLGGYLVTQHSNRDCAVVRLKMSTLSIISLYCDINSTTTRAWELPEKECMASEKVVLCIDANASHPAWGGGRGHLRGRVRGKETAEIMNALNLHICNSDNTGPTFLGPKNRSSHIDVTCCTMACIRHVTGWALMKEDFGSDHRAIAFRYGGVARATGERGNEPLKRPWKNPSAKALKMMEDLLPRMVRYRRRINTEADIYSFWRQHVSEIKYALDRMFPPRKNRCKTRCYWWNEEVAVAHRKYQSARRRMRRIEKARGGTCEEARSKVKQARGEWRYAAKRAKIESWKEYTSRIMDPWSGIHKVVKALNIGRGRYATLADGGGVYGEDILCTLRMLAEQFFPPLPPETEEHHTIQRELTRQLSHWEKGSDIGELEFRKALENMVTTSAPGEDGVTSNIIRILVKAGWEGQYIRLFNASLRLAKLPAEWKRASIVLIPKGGALTTTTKSVRPISLTPILGKLMERVVNQRVTYELETAGGLCRSQHAYRKGGSTLTALYEAISTIEAARSRSGICQAVFLDISGAFDRTWHAGILHEALQLGVSKYIVRWLREYLSGRTAIFEAGGVKHEVALRNGCPQGGVLSPTLWNILFNRFLLLKEEHVPAGAPPIRIIGYADDALVLCESKTVASARRRLQRFMKKIQEWAETYRVVFNPTKMSTIIFGRAGNRARANESSGIVFNRVDIRIAEQYKYLGVLLDSKMTWAPHISINLEKLRHITRMIRGTVRETWGVKTEILRIFFNCIFKPVMLYGVSVWASGARSQRIQKQFDKVIRDYALMATRTFRTSSQAVILQILGTKPFGELVEEELMRTSLLQLQITGRHVSDMRIQSTGKMMDMLRRSWAALDPTVHLAKHPNLLHYHETHPREWFQPKCEYADRIASLWNSTDTSGWIICTDASASSYGWGWAIAVFRHGFLRNVRFGSLRHASIFTTELYAIYQAAREIREIRAGIKEQIEVWTDSLASVRALEHSVVVDPNLRICWKEYAKRKEEGYKVTLRWVPGHEGVEGNELVDRVARKAVDSRQSSEMFTVARDVRRMINRKLDIQMAARHSMVTSKAFRTFVPNIAALKSLQRKSLTGCTNQMVTGHCRINHYLAKIGVMDSAACQCGNQDETVEHFVCFCPIYEEARREVWGKQRLNMEEVNTGTWEQLERFVNITGRLINPIAESGRSTAAS